MLSAYNNLPMSPLLELSVKDGVPSVHVGVEPSALPAGGVHVRPPPRLLLPPLSTLSDDLVSLPPLPLPLPLLSKCTSDMLRTDSLEIQQRGDRRDARARAHAYK